MGRPLASPLLALALLSACGDDDGGAADAAPPDAPAVDAAPDAPVADAPPPADARPLDPSTCPATYGPTSLLSGLSIAADESTAFDLDGDGTGDNSLAPVASVVNMSTANQLMDGSLRALTELRMVDDATLTADPQVQAVIYVAVDQDVPVDPMDDFGGAEHFWFDHDSVEPDDCAPRALLDGMIMDARFTNVPTDAITIPLGSFGTADFGVPRIDIALTAAAAPALGFTMDAGSRLGGAIPTCPLNMSDSGIAGMPNLWALVQLFQIQPDIDLDGDGLERMVSDSGGIYQCIDGDGTTTIDGADCPCDPRIADGYSVLFELSGAGSALDGPRP